MSKTANARYAAAMDAEGGINSRVVEALYIEALVLSEAARGGFDALREAAVAQPRSLCAAVPAPDQAIGPVDVEVTCEALRTTTRVMHCLAWLLNHRAWFAGQISGAQLRRHGRLIGHLPASDPTVVRRLPEDLADLVDQSERLYARIERLDAAWRSNRPPGPGAIDRLRERLASTL